MTELPNKLGFNFRGLYCYKDASLDPWTFSYLPGAPRPELNPSGKPIISLLVSDRGAILQLQTRWDTEPEVLAALKAEIANCYPELDLGLITLELARVTSEGVSLRIGDGQSEPKEIATFNSSGFPPYPTLIHARLTSDEKAQALSALEGLENRLLVSYQLVLPLQTIVKTTIEGDVALDLKALAQTDSANEEHKSISLKDCLAQIEIAIAEKRLTLTQEEINEVSEELRVKGIQAAKQYAAKQLLRRVQRNIFPDESLLKVTDEQTEMRYYQLEHQTDVASWFPEGDGLNYMQVSPTPIEEPTRPDSEEDTEGEEEPQPDKHPITEKRVSISFDAQDAPIHRFGLLGEKRQGS